jgi:4-diphosphocytidyl-2-C-methyl-D-erythritol kinase
LPKQHDETNLVHRAARAFFAATKLPEGIHIELKKNIPQQAGLGGGSGDAASTLLGLNRLFGEPLSLEDLHRLAAGLGSDVPFFLQPHPALATGRGEILSPRQPFRALRNKYFVLFHPGFGVSTGWAYAQLARHEECLHGKPGRAEALATALEQTDAKEVWDQCYNSFEKPVFDKFPVLGLMAGFMVKQGAHMARMSGSGSAIFAVVDDPELGHRLCHDVCQRYGIDMWNAVVPANG